MTVVTLQDEKTREFLGRLNWSGPLPRSGEIVAAVLKEDGPEEYRMVMQVVHVTSALTAHGPCDFDAGVVLMMSKHRAWDNKKASS